MAALSKADYLKRYMSNSELSELPKEEKEKEKKKKRRKVKPSKDTNFKIIDDDLGLAKLKKSQEIEDEEEYQPTVAQVIDERPKHVQDLEKYRKSSKWKTVEEDEKDNQDMDSLSYGVIETGHDTVRPVRRQRHDSSNSDASPPRRKSSSSKSKNPTKERKRHGSDSDMSPDRNPKNTSIRKSTSVQSKHKRNRHDSDSDSSVKNIRNKGSESDQSPPRKTKGSSSVKSSSRRRNDSGSDQSPPRKRNDSDSDNSPPRKRSKTDSDQSPPRKNAASDSDQSPPRKRKASDSDQSPQRRGQKTNESDKSPPRRKRKSRFDSPESESKGGKATKTLGGAKAGLSSAREMREEALKLRAKEDKAFGAVDEDALGRNAKTVMRDKETGKRRNMQAEEAAEKEEQRKKDELQKKYKQWGQGMKQQQVHQTTLADHVHEASKPLARYHDDQDLDSMKRQEERAEDPMLAFMRKKKEKEDAKNGPKKKKKELPKYKGRVAPPPNRFNIMPGYRWDGVDRSTGFEKKIYAAQANKKAISEIAYKWSTEDM